ECEHQRIRQAALVIVAIDIGRRDEVPIVVDHLGYVHRQTLADDIVLRPLSDGRLSPVVPQLMIDESVLGESGQQSLEIETVGCFNVGRHQGWEGDGSVWRNGGFHHGVGFERFWAIARDDHARWTTAWPV